MRILGFPASASMGYKPRCQKATAFSAMAAETLEPEVNSMGMGEGLEEGLVEIGPSPEDSRGVYIPDFLAEAPVGGNWVLTGRVARAIQADEKLKQRCFACQSPDHFIRDCPQAKNGRRPQQPRGPQKNNSASVSGKERIQSSTPTLLEPSRSAPQK